MAHSACVRRIIRVALCIGGSMRDIGLAESDKMRGVPGSGGFRISHDFHHVVGLFIPDFARLVVGPKFQFCEFAETGKGGMKHAMVLSLIEIQSCSRIHLTNHVIQVSGFSRVTLQIISKTGRRNFLQLFPSLGFFQIVSPPFRTAPYS